MSGLAALVRTDGGVVETGDVAPLVGALRIRGPDGDAMWCAGSVGLGHTLHRAGERGSGRQPLTVDGTSWIVFDGRLDDRIELGRQLGIGSFALVELCDARLVLTAYRQWGERLVERLLGDFAFVIWDGAARRLFCARDHLGIRPLYYARTRGWLLVSSAIDAIRSHPASSERLDDLAIADFLLFGFNADHASTAFAEIRRVPPAHTLTLRDGSMALRRYWDLPVEEPAYLGDAEYAERLRELLAHAVADRLCAPAAGLFLSGGLDSAALAALAAKRLGAGAVRGVTFRYETLIEDGDGAAGAAAARELGVPSREIVLDRPPGWPEPLIADAPEPFVALSESPARRAYLEMSAHSPIALYGEGPDNALFYEWRPYVSQLWKSARWGRLAADGLKFAAHHRRLPFLGTIRSRWQRSASADQGSTIPAWMPRGLVEQLNLGERYAQVMGPLHSLHPTRPTAHASLLAPVWHTVFDGFDPSCTGAALDVRYPFLDVRVLRFMLQVPVIPWCREKHLLRCAMRGILPETIRRRPKQVSTGLPDRERVRRSGLPPLRPTPQLERFGDPARLRGRDATPDESDAELRFVVLSHWLARVESAAGTG